MQRNDAAGSFQIMWMKIKPIKFKDGFLEIMLLEKKFFHRVKTQKILIAIVKQQIQVGKKGTKLQKSSFICYAFVLVLTDFLTFNL